MLVLTRKKLEVIDIGDDISVTVVEIRGDKVRLGIEAPLRLPVHRREVTLAIKAELEKAEQHRRETLGMESNG
jgi:carbon storage regulator